MGALLCRRAAHFGGSALSFSEKRVSGGFDCLCHSVLAFHFGNYRMYGAYRGKSGKACARQTSQTE